MQTTKSLKYWQWRTIIVTMIGYAMFYLVRKNFSFSMPGLQADFGITKTQLGIFLVFTLPNDENNDTKALLERISQRHGTRIVYRAEETGLGSTKYTVVDIDKK